MLFSCSVALLKYLSTFFREAINLNSDPAQWLTVVASSSATLNTCGSTSQRRSVQFGINMRTGCFIRCFFQSVLTYAFESSSCSSVLCSSFSSPLLSLSFYILIVLSFSPLCHIFHVLLTVFVTKCLFPLFFMCHFQQL